MGNNKKKNSKKNKKSSWLTKINWKLVSIICAVLIVVATLVIVVTKSAATKKDKILDVAFLEIPETISTSIKDKITSEYSGQINFTSLTKEEISFSKFNKQYDLLFTWNGSTVNNLLSQAQTIPSEAYEVILDNTVPSNKKYVPLLLNHYEVNYYTKGMERANLNFPQNIKELESFLEAMKSQVFVPFFCIGSIDDDLLSFISALVEAHGGPAAVEKLSSLLEKNSDLYSVLDEPLVTGDSPLSLHTILDLLLDWQKRDLIYSKWYSAKVGDLINMSMERQIGVFFVSLARHRELAYEIVSGYTTDRMPVVDVTKNHGLIAPELVCMSFTESRRFDSIITSLVQQDYQKQLSKDTKLAPVSLRAQAYDRQADDVRFLAAACPAGPVASIADSVFQTSKEKESALADQIRNYIRKYSTE